MKKITKEEIFIYLLVLIFSILTALTLTYIINASSIKALARQTHIIDSSNYLDQESSIKEDDIIKIQGKLDPRYHLTDSSDGEIFHYYGLKEFNYRYILATNNDSIKTEGEYYGRAKKVSSISDYEILLEKMNSPITAILEENQILVDDAQRDSINKKTTGNFSSDTFIIFDNDTTKTETLTSFIQIVLTFIIASASLYIISILLLRSLNILQAKK